MSIKPIGFLQEDFHSEVLDFLFEAITNIYPDMKLILYNDQDRYNNKYVLSLKYKNLSIKKLKNFIPDLVYNLCQKIFVVSYDNLIALPLLLNYRKDLLFIAHSKIHTQIFNSLNLNYFSLTPLLHEKYMLPLLKSHNSYILDNLVLLKNDSEMKPIIDNNNLTVVLLIGHFHKDNKNIELIEQLLKTNKICLLICCHEVSCELVELQLQFPKNVIIRCPVASSMIFMYINYYKIKYLFFVPNKTSDFYTSSWSGSIAFAFDNNLCIIMPKNLSLDVYKFNKGIINYNDINIHDDTEFIIDELNKQLIDYESLQQIRNYNFDRNKLLIEEFLTKNTEFNGFSNFLLTKLPNISKLLDNTVIINNNYENELFSLELLNLSKTCKIYNFEKDLNFAKLEKEKYSSYNNRVKFFNNHLGESNVKNMYKNGFSLDMLTLDSLNCNYPISIIKLNSDNYDIIYGSTNIINKFKPIIFIKDLYTLENNDFLTNLYNIHMLEDYSIYIPKDT